MHLTGLGVPRRDEAEAVRCFRLAAEEGYANTQFSLAASFAEGLGVSQDDVQVYLWLTPAYITYRTADQREMVEWGALAIGTTGYDEDFWIDRRGLPTTEQLRTIERLTRTDLGRML